MCSSFSLSSSVVGDDNDDDNNNVKVAKKICISKQHLKSSIFIIDIVSFYSFFMVNFSKQNVSSVFLLSTLYCVFVL